MKISRIEPFANSATTDSELERVKAELDEKQTQVPAAAEDPEAFRPDLEHEGDPQEGLIRFSDFLKKQAEKRKEARSSQHLKGLKSYKTQKDIQYKNDEESFESETGFKKVA